jgi:hypothetical protein
MNRRGFLLGAGGILAAAAAPAIVRADSLMRIVPRDTDLLWPGAFVRRPAQVSNELFKGEIGRYTGVNIISDPRAIAVYSAALAAEITRKSHWKLDEEFYSGILWDDDAMARVLRGSK